MIVIDKISLRFTAKNESFAYDLYAEWDEFCRQCISSVLDEYLTAFDKKDSCIELERLDLNLGNIPEKEFHEQFPIRLREELERQFRPDTRQDGGHLRQAERRLENILHYLAYGICLPEWSDGEFDLPGELLFILEHLREGIARVGQLCFGQAHGLERLMAGTDKRLFIRLTDVWNDDRAIPKEEKQQTMSRLAASHPGAAMRLLEKVQEEPALLHGLATDLNTGLEADLTISETTRMRIRMQIAGQISGRLRPQILEIWKESLLWLASPAVSQFERQRYLAVLLETEPERVVRFIRETREEESLDRLADLLDSVTVRQIMAAECESHAEVDVPQYWHYLYNWLLEHYPFNGIYMFGDKRRFHKHLNVKFLSFIRKRAYSAYLSKAELTVQFLLEVFGREHYREVLNVIYGQQARNADGSPVYTGYFNMELYHMFLRLSLLKQPFLRQASEGGAPAGFRTWTEKLTDNRTGREEKRSLLNLIAREQPAVLLEWIKSADSQQELLAQLAGLTDDAFVHRLVASVSFHTAELFGQLAEYLYANAVQIGWLTGVSTEKLSFLIRKSALRQIATGHEAAASPQESAAQLLRLLHREVTGNADERSVPDEAGEKEISQTIREVTGLPRWPDGTEGSAKGLAGQEPAAGQENRCTALPLQSWIERLRNLLREKTHSVFEKRRGLARLWDAYRKDYANLIPAMQAEGLLKESIEFTDEVLFDRIIASLAEQAAGRQGPAMLPFFRWIWAQNAWLNPYLTGGSSGLKERAMLLLAQWSTENTATGKSLTEATRLFIAGLFGTDQAGQVLRLMERKLILDGAGKTMPDEKYETENTLGMLLRITGRTTAENKEGFQTAFEQHFDTPEHFIHWLKQAPQTGKQEILQRYAAAHPSGFVRLLRQCPKEGGWIGPLLGIAKTAAVLQWIGAVSPSKAEILFQALEQMQRKPTDFSMFPGGGSGWTESLSKALLLFLLDERALNDSVARPDEITRRLAMHLYEACTGQTSYGEAETAQRQQFFIHLATGRQPSTGMEPPAEAAPLPFMQEKEPTDRGKLRRRLALVMEYRPGLLLSLVEKDTGKAATERLAEIADSHLAEQWAALLSTSVHPSGRVAFRQLMAWIMRDFSGDASAKTVVRTLLLWVKERDWRTATADRQTAFFFSRLYDKPEAGYCREACTFLWGDDTLASEKTVSGERAVSPEADPLPSPETGDPIEKSIQTGNREMSVGQWEATATSDWLENPSVHTEMKQRIVQQYIRWQPELLLAFIRRSIARQTIPADQWKEWLDETDWFRLMSAVSLSKAEVLRQAADYLREKGAIETAAVQTGLMRFLTETALETRLRMNTSDTVWQFVQSLQPAETTDAEKGTSQAGPSQEETRRQITIDLRINEADENTHEENGQEEPEYIPVGNAGLALLAPWFPLLFDRLGLLNEKKEFKDTKARVRAVFILQRLTTAQEREYREQELAFNRILVNCPFSVPLPKKLELTEKEMETADAMLSGVMANWPKMKNTSVAGFRHSFIERDGHLEPQEKKWILAVDERSYDILLDSLPWSYRLIRFPWLKKQIHVFWRSEKESAY